MLSVIPLQIPGGSDLGIVLAMTVIPSLSIATLVLFSTYVRNERHWLAWPIAAFLAGFGNVGFGSAVVGVLYVTIRE